MTQTNFQTARFDHPAVVLKPFVWTAILSFATGFAGYFAFGAALGFN